MHVLQITGLTHWVSIRLPTDLSVPPFRYDLKIVLTIVWSGRCHFLLSLRTVYYIGRLGNTLLLHSWPIDCRSWPPPPCCSSAAGCTRQVRLTICCRPSFVLPLQRGDGSSGSAATAAAAAGSRVCTCAWLVILYFFSSPDNFFADWVISLFTYMIAVHLARMECGKKNFDEH